MVEENEAKENQSAVWTDNMKLQSAIRVRQSYLEISNTLRALYAFPRCAPLPPKYFHGRGRQSFSTTRLSLRSALGVASDQSILDAYKSSILFPPSTVRISKQWSTSGLKSGDVVILHGYLGNRADVSKKLSFVPLMDRNLHCTVQVVSKLQHSPNALEGAHERIKALEANTPVAIRGILRERPPSKEHAEDPSQIRDFEVELLELQPLNAFPKDIIVKPDTIFPPEDRHLQIRTTKSLRDALEFRAKVGRLCREELGEKQGFVEIETPLLFKSTPEGAREFIVPTRRRGLAYALPQSPQQFKQILMGSGISRYYQIARCFRDEDLRADRQPEFTQLDLEMGFATAEDVMSTIEKLLITLWKQLLDIDLPSPFPRMSYQDAMAAYGSDKPDVRLGMPISRVERLLPEDLIAKITPLSDPIIEMIHLRCSQEIDDAEQMRSFITSFMESPDAIPFTTNPEGGPGIFVYDRCQPLHGLQALGFEATGKLDDMVDLDDGDCILLQARANTPFAGGSTPMGNLRLALHRHGVKQGRFKAPEGFAPLWVTDFPLFSPTSLSATEPGQGGSAGIASTHHPFTSPKTAVDVDLLLESPLDAVGDHYDIVMNGIELGGGSRRIHNSAMQRLVMEKVLKMSRERVAEFEHLLEVLRAGCPPHAGIALGFDRLVAVMLGRESVRDVIAFPKSGRGEDLMVKSPGSISQETLDLYHLRLKSVREVGH